ncbi:uncharacterized protein CC84DRAFT_1250355 [Paraphaeosphaeria sporulosa]|uniref:Uncharacterized protein n=1 Tax=Paraphaeosphaeria sporulosa TaxID=1460663 RepID=A0A177C6V6_9PLEO|nr:uncharacterized protein CC84DRAFT_1250355 [Paraphaeosphaeria sporulosa]OAG02602.1 hypothetical protein CC84DRAFT_1250355 [Paraphaeosphaeria sporulosa]
MALYLFTSEGRFKRTLGLKDLLPRRATQRPSERVGLLSTAQGSRIGGRCANLTKTLGSVDERGTSSDKARKRTECWTLLGPHSQPRSIATQEQGQLHLGTAMSDNAAASNSPRSVLLEGAWKNGSASAGGRSPRREEDGSDFGATPTPVVRFQFGRSSRLTARTRASWRPGTQQTLFLYQHRHTHSSLITLALRPSPNNARGASAEQKFAKARAVHMSSSPAVRPHKTQENGSTAPYCVPCCAV